MQSIFRIFHEKRARGCIGICFEKKKAGTFGSRLSLIYIEKKRGEAWRDYSFLFSSDEALSSARALAISSSKIR